MQQLSSMLAAKISNTGDAIVVGMHKSGIVAATALGAARNTRYAWTTPDRIAANAIEYLEDHRPDKAHYLYGLPKGSNVILVEDEITTGRGIASFATALKAHGMTVVAIASYIETVNFDGRKYIRDTTSLELISLIKVRLS